jgi:hypothetical protein
MIDLKIAVYQPNIFLMNRNICNDIFMVEKQWICYLFFELIRCSHFVKFNKVLCFQERFCSWMIDFFLRFSFDTHLDRFSERSFGLFMILFYWGKIFWVIWATFFLLHLFFMLIHFWYLFFRWFFLRFRKFIFL